MSHRFTSTWNLLIGSIDEVNNGTRDLHRLLSSTLPKLNSLKTFRIDIFNGFTGVDLLDSDIQWDFAIKCLEILASSPAGIGDSLERVTIGINGLYDLLNDCGFEEAVDESLDWGGLEAVLRKFSNLSRFTLIVRSEDELVVWEETAVKKLPWLKEKLKVLEEDCGYFD